MNWICTECAERIGSCIPDGHIATFHPDVCDVCGQKTIVTEPRDFRPRPDVLYAAQSDAVRAQLKKAAQ